MDPITISMVVAAGVAAVSQVVGGLIQAGKTREAQQLLDEASKHYDNIPLPNLEMMADQTVGPSAFESMNIDPTGRDAQVRAIERMRDIEGHGGMDVESRALQNNILNGEAQQESAIRGRILDNMRARGLSGSGMEVAAQLQNAQAQADRASKSGTDLAAQAQRRYLDSILQGGQMGGSLRQQDFGEASRTAQARDAIAAFNANARERGAAQRNQAAQQTFANNITLTDRQTQGKRDQAAALLGQGKSDAQTAVGIGNAVGQGATAVGAYAGRPKTPERGSVPATYQDPYGIPEDYDRNYPYGSGY